MTLATTSVYSTKAVTLHAIQNAIYSKHNQVISDAEYYVKWGSWIVRLHTLVGRSKHKLAQIQKVHNNLAATALFYSTELTELEEELAKAQQALSRDKDFDPFDGRDVTRAILLFPFMLFAGSTRRRTPSPQEDRVDQLEYDIQRKKTRKRHVESLIASLDALIASA